MEINLCLVRLGWPWPYSHWSGSAWPGSAPARARAWAREGPAHSPPSAPAHVEGAANGRRAMVLACDVVTVAGGFFVNNNYYLGAAGPCFFTQ